MSAANSNGGVLCLANHCPVSVLCLLGKCSAYKYCGQSGFDGAYMYALDLQELSWKIVFACATSTLSVVVDPQDSVPMGAPYHAGLSC